MSEDPRFVKILPSSIALVERVNEGVAAEHEIIIITQFLYLVEAETCVCADYVLVPCHHIVLMMQLAVLVPIEIGIERQGQFFDSAIELMYPA